MYIHQKNSTTKRQTEDRDRGREKGEQEEEEGKGREANSVNSALWLLLLPQPPKCRNYGPVPPYPACAFLKKAENTGKCGSLFRRALASSIGVDTVFVLVLAFLKIGNLFFGFSGPTSQLLFLKPSYSYNSYG